MKFLEIAFRLIPVNLYLLLYTAAITSKKTINFFPSAFSRKLRISSNCFISVITKIKISAVINKADLNEGITETIEHYLNSEHIPLTGKILFDETVVFSLQQEKCILDFPESKAAEQITKIWHTIQNY